MRVRVVGAGVIGLSCAVRLREAGVDANVVAAEQGARTTSAVAAAIWYPYRAGPVDRVRAWGRTTFHELVRLAADQDTGVLMRSGTQRLRSPAAVPEWAADIPGFQASADSWTFAAPVADTTVYLHWLTARLATLGGTVAEGHVASADEALAGVDHAVLATGLGARTLPGDPSVTGARGQIVLVRAPHVHHWLLDDDHPAGMTYVVPRHQDVVCGGTDVPEAADVLGTAGAPGAAVPGGANLPGTAVPGGADLPGAADVAPSGANSPATRGDRGADPEVAAAILRRCTDAVPELAGAEILGHRVGVRPVRPEVRVEREGALVHCYGHGGAGFTLSWGCANDVRTLLLDT